MHVYVWERLSNMSGNYHTAGGVVAIAESLDAARALFVAEEGGQIDGEPDILRSEPDFVLGCDMTEPRVFVFPDAGCC